MGRDHSEDLGVAERIILEWISEKRGERCGLPSPGSGHGPVAGFCELGSEPSGSIKGGKYLE
jgi:hypothetical protein